MRKENTHGLHQGGLYPYEFAAASAFPAVCTDDFEHERLPYSEWLKKESDPIHKRLEQLYPISEEMDEAAADLTQALTAFEEVYMEIGMKAGARLLFHLLVEDE